MKIEIQVNTDPVQHCVDLFNDDVTPDGTCFVTVSLRLIAGSLWPKTGKNTDKIVIQSLTVPRANGRANGPVLQSVFLALIDHSAQSICDQTRPIAISRVLAKKYRQTSKLCTKLVYILANMLACLSTCLLVNLLTCQHACSST